MAADAYSPDIDRYPNNIAANWQARNAVVVTPSDTQDITNPAGDGALYYAKALYIGVTGNVAVILAGDDVGNPVTFQNHPVGYMPVQVRRVMNTNTTASDIVALTD
jgi:hypothetical protein